MTASRLEMSGRLAAIEAALDAGAYRIGMWDEFVRAARQLSRADRLAIAEEVSRVSRKLHSRRTHSTLSVAGAIALEALATVIAGVALAAARAVSSNALAVGAALVWVTTLQPLVKVAVGSALGLRYDYAYIDFGVEPRFKMRYGLYLALARWKRVLLHLSGMVGSPLAAWIAARAAAPQLATAARICSGLFWATLLVNAALFGAALLGVQRIGRLRLAATSGGMAARELRRADAAG